MMQWLQRLLGQPGSSATAKERLRLVLLSDHLSLAPDVIDALKGDLIAVISKYVEVDEAQCDVTFEHQEHGVAMLANIPIIGMHRRPTPPAPAAPPTPPSGGGLPATASAALAHDEPAVAATTISVEPDVEIVASAGTVNDVAALPTPAESAVENVAPRPPRRRRRRRAATSTTLPNPAT